MKKHSIQLLLMMTLCLCCTGLSAQTAPGAQPPAGKDTSKTPKKNPANPNINGGTGTSTGTSNTAAAKKSIPVQVESVRIRKDDGNLDTGSAGIGDLIVLKIAGLQQLLRTAKCQDDAGSVKSGCIIQTVKLCINDRMMDDIAPESGAPDTAEGTLSFRLTRSANNDAEWADLLGKPSYPHFFEKGVHISVGLSGGYAEKSVAPVFRFTRIRQCWFWFCVLITVIYFLLLFIYGKSKNFLRDGGVDLNVVGINRVTNLPFSLGKLQMAFWFSLVLISFLFIWLITGNTDVITPGTLGLVGISAATALSAVAIDSGKGQDAIKQIQTLQTQLAALKLAETDLKTQLVAKPGDPLLTNTLTFNQSTQTDNQNQINTIATNVNVPGSGNLLTDILEDVNGVSFHRLQMLIWTLVLGIIFCSAVWSRLSMPEFSSIMLAMQGITSGTYLGFKFPEKQS